MSNSFLLAAQVTSQDVVVAPIWLIVNLLLAAAAWRTARRLCPSDSELESVGYAVLLAWATVVAVAQALGLAGRLTGPLLLGGAGGVAFFTLVASRILPPATAVTARTDGRWIWVWALALAFGLGHIVVQGLLRFPEDWDSLAYHLPMVDHWLQAGHLYTPDCGRWSSPGNNELLALWAVAPFSGDFLASLNNLPATVLLGCGAVALGRRLGLSRPLAHLGGLALVCHTVVLIQLVDAENDVAVAACFFATLAAAVRHAERQGTGDLVLGAIGLGLLGGVKFYAAGYAALALAVWVLLAASNGGRQPGLCALLGGLAGLTGLASYWYLRNLAATGSPLYPREFFKHPDVLTQIYPEVAYSSFFGNRRPELPSLYLEGIWKMTGPCLSAGFLLTPLSALWLAASGARSAWRDRPRRAGRRLALAALLAGTGLLLGMTPFAVEDDPGTLNQMLWYYCPVRYGLCFLGTATLAGLVLLQHALTGGRRAGWLKRGGHPWRVRLLRGAAHLPHLVLAGGILVQLSRPERRGPPVGLETLLVAGNLALAGLALWLIASLWPGLRRALPLVIVVATLPAWSWTCARLADRWHAGYVRHYDHMLGGGFAALREQDLNGTKVCALVDLYYPFFGSRRERAVYQPHHVPSPGWLLRLIDAENMAIVAVQPRLPPRRFEGFDECRASAPDRFRPITKAPGFWLFRVIPHEGGDGGWSGRGASVQ